MYYTNLNSPDQTYDINYPKLHIIEKFFSTKIFKFIILFIIILFLLMKYASYNYVLNDQNLNPNFSIRKGDLYLKNEYKLIDDFRTTESNRKISEELTINDFNTFSDQQNFKNINNSSYSLMTDLTSCPFRPPNLIGRIKLMNEDISIDELKSLHPELDDGGHYSPPNCKAIQKIAIIIPYRNREKHLRKFLHNMHPFLQKQQAEYVIYVVEQYGDYRFNRAKLLNIGFVEALKQYDFDCFIFHDIDLLPEDDRNLYRCSEQPKHLSVAVNTFNYELPYANLFGGVFALSKKQMIKINGFSNTYWGWGGEDDDMSKRIRYKGFQISRYDPEIARYTMLNHKKANPNPKRYKKLKESVFKIQTDGINSLDYNRLILIDKKLYTWILCDLKPPN